MDVFKKLTNSLGLAGGCIAGIIILPFFVAFLMIRAAARGLYNMTRPNAKIPNPESPFNKPQPAHPQNAPSEEEK